MRDKILKVYQWVGFIVIWFILLPIFLYWLGFQAKSFIENVLSLYI